MVVLPSEQVTSGKGQKWKGGRAIVPFVAFYLFKKERPEANNIYICEK